MTTDEVIAAVRAGLNAEFRAGPSSRRYVAIFWRHGGGIEEFPIAVTCFDGEENGAAWIAARNHWNDRHDRDRVHLASVNPA
jgi:hypothetical protein